MEYKIKGNWDRNNEVYRMEGKDEKQWSIGWRGRMIEKMEYWMEGKDEKQ